MVSRCLFLVAVGFTLDSKRLGQKRGAPTKIFLRDALIQYLKAQRDIGE
jgi:hypothetical protein